MSDEIKNGHEPYEEVHIDEQEQETTAERKWTEEISMAGESVLGFIQMLYRKSNVRRITVRNAEGRVLLDIPVLVGAVAFYPPLLLYSALAFGAAIFANCSVRIERAEEVSEKAPLEV
jgi:hypothetical protein